MLKQLSLCISETAVHDSSSQSTHVTIEHKYTLSAQITQGDRAGICVTQLDPGQVERGVVCAPGTVPTFTGAIVSVEKIRFFAGQVCVSVCSWCLKRREML